MRAELLLLLIVGCGTELASTTTDPESDAGTAAGDGGDGGGDAGAPDRLATLPCGTITCVAGQQACCLSAFGPFCSGIGTSCPTNPDAGADAAPPALPLACVTYRNCDEQQCCFTPDAGSNCSDNCSVVASPLCLLEDVKCEGSGSGLCVQFAASPDPATIGRCAGSN